MQAPQLSHILGITLRLILRGIVQVYRYVLSPLKVFITGQCDCCRFQPTCSRYALEAIQTHGPLYGSYLSIKRILRCNPLFRAGYDPVPKTRKTLKTHAHYG